MDGLLLKYFVLRPKGIDAHAQASREAMLAYSNRMSYSNPLLAGEIASWVKKEQSEADKC